MQRTMATLAVMLLSACSRAVVPPPVVTSAPPAAAPPLAPLPPPVVTGWTIPPALPSTRYLVEVSAALERDSLGRVLQEHVDTRALISLQGRRDSTGRLRANGAVDSFSVRGLERALAPANPNENETGKLVPVLPQLPAAISFDAVIDDHNIRVTTRPPLANECDRPESGATNIVHELLVRLPRTLTVGAQWSDSTVGFQCRLGVPIVSRTRASYIVDRAETVKDRTQLLLRRTTDTQLDGNTRSTWRTITISGTGRATHTIRIDAASGIVQSIEGDGLLTVRLSDTGRRDGPGTQEVRQTTHSRTSLHK